jgi:hypothetical protein
VRAALLYRICPACPVWPPEDFCCVQRKSIFWCKTRNSAAGRLVLCWRRRGKTKRVAAKLWSIAASVAVLVAKLRSAGHGVAVGAQLERRAWLRLAGEDRLPNNGATKLPPIGVERIARNSQQLVPTIVGGPISTEKFGHARIFRRGHRRYSQFSGRDLWVGASKPLWCAGRGLALSRKRCSLMCSGAAPTQRALSGLRELAGCG